MKSKEHKIIELNSLKKSKNIKIIESNYGIKIIPGKQIVLNETNNLLEKFSINSIFSSIE